MTERDKMGTDSDISLSRSGAACHLCITGGWVMYTFDSRFCKKARELGISPAVQVLS